MAYYSGQVSSYQELLDVLVASCVIEGWTWADQILAKDSCFVRVTYNANATPLLGSGLLFQGGTGKTGSSLINASSAIMRVGPFSSISLVPAPTFPIQYHIFIFDIPNEVYLVIKYSNDRFLFSAFGQSTIGGNGLWLSASMGLTYGQNESGGTIYISATTGGYYVPSWVASSGFFWQSANVMDSPHMAHQTIYTNIDNLGWSHLSRVTIASDAKNIAANSSLAPLLGRLPSVWSSESVLFAIQPTITRTSGKKSILADIQNARYMRIDNFEPEQIMQLGSQKWMILPFHKKNANVRNGGDGVDHTGTFGWAIRYDGP